MNLKFRFALLFTSFVAIILLLSSATIYILYASYRVEDYYTRVFYEGNEVYRVFSELKKTTPFVSAEKVREVHDKTLFREEVFIVDSIGKIVFQMPSDIQLPLPFADVKEQAMKLGKFNFIDNKNNLHLVLFKPSTKSFVFIAGYDRIGYKKLKTLQIILSAVFFGTLFLTAIMSFLFVNEAIKPIVRLSMQMQRTNELNLSERIEEKPTKDEIQSIAHHFNAMLERLKKAFEWQKSFVYHASHELRTPLSVMISQTESALNKSLTPEEYREVLTSLNEDQQHMVELTNSLLLISQYHTFEYINDWPYLRIDELLYETISIAKRLYNDINIRLEFANIPNNDEALLVKGNDSLLRSAFINLIKNAYTYSTDKNVIIIIEPNKEFVNVCVENRGDHLSPAEIDKMMIPFFRGANAANKKGFGLGLSIIERILTIHKGGLSYTAKPNQVNSFLVTLLVKEA